MMSGKALPFRDSLKGPGGSAAIEAEPQESGSLAERQSLSAHRMGEAQIPKASPIRQPKSYSLNYLEDIFGSLFPIEVLATRTNR
jgi:hypothetical protein